MRRPSLTLSASPAKDVRYVGRGAQYRRSS
jgi:hypothetical protein